MVPGSETPPNAADAGPALPPSFIPFSGPFGSSASAAAATGGTNPSDVAESSSH